jgi:hypothetical protein
LSWSNSAAGKFVSLPARDRALIAEAVFAVAAVKLALALVRFQRLLILLEKASFRFRARQLDERPAAGRIVWAIDAASGRIPLVNSCLPRALAARFLLVRWGYPAELSIGVARNNDGKLEAHAWVETLGKVVIGESQPGYFSPLAVSKAARK